MSKGGGGTRTIQNVQQTMTDPTTAPFKELPCLKQSVFMRLALNTPWADCRRLLAGDRDGAVDPASAKAICGSPFIGAVQDVVMQNLTGTNPLMSAAFQPVIEQVEAEASKAGRYGSTYQQRALGEGTGPDGAGPTARAIQHGPGRRELWLR